MNEHMQWAKELKDQYPEVLKYYSQSEVKRIWEDYSHDVSAHWLVHEGINDEAIKLIFERYMIVNHWQIYKLI